MAFDTLEAAQAEIVRLTEELTATKNERDSYSAKITTMTGELENVRKLNQTYFNKLTAQHNPKPNEPDEPETPSCEEFAKTLNI